MFNDEKRLFKKGLLYGMALLGTYVVGCSRGSSSGYATGFASGQHDVATFLEQRTKTLAESFTQDGLEQYLRLHLQDLQARNQRDQPLPMDDPLYKEVIASFLALNQQRQVQKQ